MASAIGHTARGRVPGRQEGCISRRGGRTEGTGGIVWKVDLHASRGRWRCGRVYILGRSGIATAWPLDPGPVSSEGEVVHAEPRGRRRKRRSRQSCLAPSQSDQRPSRERDAQMLPRKPHLGSSLPPGEHGGRLRERRERITRMIVHDGLGFSARRASQVSFCPCGCGGRAVIPTHAANPRRYTQAEERLRDPPRKTFPLRHGPGN